ncbi:MAG: lamin tail domain-containing protein [Nanoarchaeota archaeon]
MGCKWWIFGLFLFSLSFVYAEVLISEVMYNPNGSEAGREWIEIYNEGDTSVDPKNLIFFESEGNHTLTLINGSLINPREYAIIASNDTLFIQDHPTYNKTLIYADFNSLSNSGEYLALFDLFGQKIDEVNYSSGSKDGFSIELKNLSSDNLIRSNWGYSLIFGGTPGETNSINLNDSGTRLFNIILVMDFPSEIYAGSPYTDMFNITIENKKPCTPYDNIIIEYNITGNDFFKEDNFTKEVGCGSSIGTGKFTPPSAGNYTICGNIINSTVNESNFSDNSVCFNITVIDPSTVLCDVNLNINISDTLIYKQGEPINYSFILSNKTFQFKIEYWIEDLFGNTVKSKYTTTNTYSKTWKADISEEDRVLYLKAQLYPSCKDQNLSNNYAQKMFIVTNEGALQKMNNTNSTDNTTSVNDSSILINKITPSELDWGEALRAEVEIHKGNTNKYAISAWVEIDGDQVSEVTKVNLYSKYTNYKLALPLLMDLRCEEDAQEAILVLEGLDQRAEQEVTIVESSSDCSEEETESISSDSNEKGSVDTATTNSGSEDVSYELLDFPTGISPGQILNFKVKFKGDEWDHFFQTYGYVYRGSRCYSCEAETKEREDYLQEFFLGFDEEKVVDYSLPLDGEMKPGEYKLKVRVHKDGQITAKSVDVNITVGGGEEKSMATTTSTLSKGGSSIESSSLGVQRTILNQSKFLVYESSNEKAKKLIPYILVIVLGLLCVILMKEKWERK